MQHLHLFESFIEKIYEIKLDSHWKSRSSLSSDEFSGFSRIVPKTSNTPHGYRINGVLKNGKDYLPLSNLIDQINLKRSSEGFTQIDINYIKELITKALYILTGQSTSPRMTRLKKWIPEDKQKILMMKLGKISIYDGDDYEVLLAGGDPSNKFKKGDGEFPAGEVVWGFTYNNDLGITIKYSRDNKSGNDQIYRSTMSNSKMKPDDFYDNSKIVEPYGQNFILRIDLTDPDKQNIFKKLEKQVELNTFEPGQNNKSLELNQK
jgi:hypothetical protein